MTYSACVLGIALRDDTLDAGEEGAETEATWGEEGGGGDECG